MCPMGASLLLPAKRGTCAPEGMCALAGNFYTVFSIGGTQSISVSQMLYQQVFSVSIRIANHLANVYALEYNALK